MATIVTRAGKGSPLTHSEVDANFNNINTAKLEISGGTMTGDLILSGGPSAALQAATKQYVDTIASAGIHYHTPARVEAPANLPSTYDNGTSGVGATLTNSGTQEALVIDGIALSSADRVLIYQQTDPAHNGVYTVTTVGSVSTNWVLTRATDADSYGPSDPDTLGKGDAFFISAGDTGAGETYVMTTVGTITFGTTGIVFIQISATAVYSAGTGLALDGTVFSNTITNNNQLTNGSAYITSSASISGNAATATQLQTARTIGGVSFDGTANINLAGVNIAGTQDTSGNAATATLATNATNATNATTAATTTGNAGSATVLQTARNINGVSFNGSADITVADSTKLPLAGGALTGSVTLSGDNHTTYGPNSGWGAYLRVGGNSYTATGTMASVVTSTGNLHIDSAPSAATYINYFAGTSGIVFGNGASGQVGSIDTAGNLTMSGNVTAYSDVRLKSNIQTIESGLDKVCAMRGVTFEKDGVRNLGVIAQEVEAVIPEVVMTQNDGMKSVAYGNIVGVLIEAIKELKLEIEILKGN